MILNTKNQLQKTLYTSPYNFIYNCFWGLISLNQSNSDLKNTPLLNEHLKLGATMIPFGGWNMPVQYTNVIDEHISTRTKVGIFDIRHMGEFIVSGKNNDKNLSNNVSRLDGVLAARKPVLKYELC